MQNMDIHKSILFSSFLSQNRHDCFQHLKVDADEVMRDLCLFIGRFVDGVDVSCF